jgi:curli biogenesis system outer membrane secretion channel CsgG
MRIEDESTFRARAPEQEAFWMKGNGLRTLAIGVAAVLATVLSTANVAMAQEAKTPKKRLAVIKFEYGTVDRWWGGSNWDIGKGIAELLEKELVKNGTYSLYSRRSLDAVIAEKRINEGDPAMRSTIGKVAGVGAVIVGTVTQFGFDDKNFKIGGGVIGQRAGALGSVLGGVGTKQSKATVVVTAQIIDIATGEILATAEGKGDSRRGGITGLGGLFDSRGGVVGGIDMSASNFQNTILGEATRKCVENLAKEFVKAEPRVPRASRSLLGKVADVEGSTLTMNVGVEQGVQTGDTLVIERVVKVIKDPDTGAVIDEKTEIVGSVRISEVKPKASSGAFSGSGAPKAGDRVRLK